MSTTPWALFTKDERVSILDAYNRLFDDVMAERRPKEKDIMMASKGMLLDPKKNYLQMFKQIIKSKEEGAYPIAHENSVVAWVNKAVELYGLNDQDILSMKFGDTIDVYFLDNEHHGDTPDELFTIGTYIHCCKLSGMMKIGDDVIVDFKWDLNSNIVDGKHIFVKEEKLPKKRRGPAKVGFGSPVIRVSDAKKYMPKKMKLYGTDWDDTIKYIYNSKK